LEGFPVCVSDRAQDQYFGRCETAHLRACSIGPYGDSAARKRRTVGNASMRSRQAEQTGWRWYIALPSSVRANEKVLGNR
jgi:hypothetical protein